MGAPPKNANRLDTGGRSLLPIPELENALAPVADGARTYRKQLMAATLELKGEVSVNDFHHINTAARCELIARACAWRLRTRGPSLSDERWLAYADRIANLSSRRDDAIRRLGLDAAKLPDAGSPLDDMIAAVHSGRLPAIVNGSRGSVNGYRNAGEPARSDATTPVDPTVVAAGPNAAERKCGDPANGDQTAIANQRNGDQCLER